MKDAKLQHENGWLERLCSAFRRAVIVRFRPKQLGRETLAAGSGHSFAVLESGAECMTEHGVDDARAARACVVVLDRALLFARLLVSDGKRRGLDASRAAQLHQLLDAVHNIPGAVLDHDGACRLGGVSRTIICSAFQDYDAEWGPLSPHGAREAGPTRRLSLVGTYEFALARSRHRPSTEGTD